VTWLSETLEKGKGNGWKHPPHNKDARSGKSNKHGRAKVKSAEA
jgi:hypothetical protein